MDIANDLIPFDQNGEPVSTEFVKVVNNAKVN